LRPTHEQIFQKGLESDQKRNNQENVSFQKKTAKLGKDKASKRQSNDLHFFDTFYKIFEGHS